MAEEFRRNAEGYADPTAYHAIRHIEDEERERLNDLIFVLKYVIRSNGFELVERMQFRSRKTGKIYK